MTEENQHRGRMNELRGRQTEAIVEAYHIAAKQLGVARLIKLPTPTKRGDGGQIIFTKRSAVDFVGMMLDGTARHVAEEVKSFYDGPSFTMGRVEAHQRQYLDMVQNAGGVAVLTLVDKLSQVYVLDWSVVRTKVSLTWDDLREERVRPAEYLKRYVRRS